MHAWLVDMYYYTIVADYNNFQFKDVLQLMIEASDQSQTEKRMDDEEIVANILNFFITNYDALAIHLCYTIYLLALNSDIQEKLQLEIDKYFINKNVIRDMHDIA